MFKNDISAELRQQREQAALHDFQAYYEQLRRFEPAN